MIWVCWKRQCLSVKVLKSNTGVRHLQDTCQLSHRSRRLGAILSAYQFLWILASFGGLESVTRVYVPRAVCTERAKYHCGWTTSHPPPTQWVLFSAWCGSYSKWNPDHPVGCSGSECSLSLPYSLRPKVPMFSCVLEPCRLHHCHVDLCLAWQQQQRSKLRHTRVPEVPQGTHGKEVWYLCNEVSFSDIFKAIYSICLYVCMFTFRVAGGGGGGSQLF